MTITRRTILKSALVAGPVLAMPALVKAQPKQVRVGLIPSEDSRAMLKSSQQLLDALEKNLGIKVQGFVASDYNGVIEAMRSSHIDVAYLGPFSYVLGTTVAPIEAFATAETAKSSRSFYRSQIIARKDSGIRDWKDLKGRTFAFVDPSSTSGHLFPKAGLLKLGFDPRRISAASSSPARMTPMRSPSPTSASTPQRSPIGFSMQPCRRSWSIAPTSTSSGSPIRSRNRRPAGARTCPTT